MSQRRLTRPEFISLLQNIENNEDFLAFVRSWFVKRPDLFVPGYLRKIDLINGFCEFVAKYVKIHHPEVDFCYSCGHWFVRFENRYYDGFNFIGVDRVDDLHFYQFLMRGKYKEVEILKMLETEANEMRTTNMTSTKEMLYA